MDDLTAIVNLMFPAFILLTESWLTCAIPDTAVAIPGYSILQKDRETRGGGLCAYVLTELCPIPLATPQFTPVLESLAFSVCCGSAISMSLTLQTTWGAKRGGSSGHAGVGFFRSF